jgi:small subunit ribosomal protein S9
MAGVASTIEYYGTGKRKHAVARVLLRTGQGEIKINERDIEKYFPSAVLRTIVRSPLAITETTDRFSIRVNVAGGGMAGQAGAVRHGISRALLEYNVELRHKLKEAGFLTRDSRIKERKKYGQKGARKRFQFSKR